MKITLTSFDLNLFLFIFYRQQQIKYIQNKIKYAFNIHESITENKVCLYFVVNKVMKYTRIY